MSERDNPAVETPDFVLAALERANDAVVIVDGTSHVSFFNAAAERIWGLDRAEVLVRVEVTVLPEAERVDVERARSLPVGGRDGDEVDARHRATQHIGIGTPIPISQQSLPSGAG